MDSHDLFPGDRPRGVKDRDKATNGQALNQKAQGGKFHERHLLNTVIVTAPLRFVSYGISKGI